METMMMIRTAVFFSLLSWTSVYAQGESEAITITRSNAQDTFAGDLGEIDSAARSMTAQGARYPERIEQMSNR